MRGLLGLGGLVVAIALLTGSASAQQAPAPATLTAFTSDSDLDAYFQRLRAERDRRAAAERQRYEAEQRRVEAERLRAEAEQRRHETPAQRRRRLAEQRLARGRGSQDGSLPPPPPPPPVMSAPVVTGALSITNNQVANVDEGDIVKARGDLLVVLRRGRLFTVSITGGRLRPISRIQAYPPGLDGSGDWYDEMLLSPAGDRVVVIGYSYRRGGTQVNRFHLSPAGELSFEDSYDFRSGDYCSTRNYASRLIGNRLILYAPIYLDADDWRNSLPALRLWRSGREGGTWQTIGGATTT